MGSKRTGSIKEVSIDGVDYPVHSDSSVSKKPPVKNEGISTSGGTVIKQTVQSEDLEGLVLSVPQVEKQEQLEYSASKLEDIQINIKYRNNDVRYIMGTVDITDGFDSADGKVTINIIPTAPVESQSA